MLPPSGLLFECVTASVFEIGTVVSMTGFGPARTEDDVECIRTPYIWAVDNREDEEYGDVVLDYYFCSSDLRPLTPSACEAYAELLALEHAHELTPYQP